MPLLAAESFCADPRIAQARALVLAALADHQRQLTGPRPADPARKLGYEELLARFAQLRGGSLYYPYLGSGFGHGALVELADGSVKFDLITGIGVHALGHNHPVVVAAALEAALHDTVMQGNLLQNVESVRLAELLVSLACRGGAKLSHCFLSTSGAMANENALKIAFQKKSPAPRVLAFAHCFMGRTLALAAVTDKAAYRQGVPVVLDVDYLPFFDPQRPQESTAAAVATLRECLHRYPGQHAVLCCEMVQGEGGYWVGDREFFLAVLRTAREHGLPIFVDEVQTFGRTSAPFAFQHYGLDELVDIVSVGKLTQVCATLFRGELAPKPGLVSQTFTGATSSLLTARAILEHLDASEAFGASGRNLQVHARFVQRFEEIAARHPGWLRGPYGLGGLIAFTPLDGSPARAAALARTLYDLGVIGFVAGDAPARLRFLPPVPALTDAQIDAVSAIIEQALAMVAKG